MSGLLITALVALVFIVIYQIAKAGELAAIIKGEEKVKAQTNKLMAWLMLIFFILGLVGLYVCHEELMDKMLPVAASDHGVKFDQMLEVTIYVTGIVFLITQFLLFYFIFRYQSTENRKPLFLSHNNKLEIIWTTVPALVLFVLVIVGLRNWITFTGDSPEGSMIVHVTGKQFNFIMRYPGTDGILGKSDFRLMNDANNPLGLDWNDPASKDDIVIENGELHLLKDVPVKLVLNSRDVIHNVGLSHFRVKMDAVPGVTTSLWFTPTITTDSMKIITNNPNFVYEIACSEMCGRGHYSMKGTVIVHDKASYKAWLDQQKPYYAGLQATPEATEAAPVQDTAAVSESEAALQKARDAVNATASTH